MRRRLYLVRHGAVSYFRPDGQPVQQESVSLNDAGRAQAAATRDLLDGVTFDRVLASDLPRTVETAQLVAPEAEIEQWSDLRELRGERLSGIPPGELEEEFVHAFRGIVPNEKRFLGGETIGELFDRVLPAVERLFADASWDTALAVLHGAVNRAILSYALTAERMFLGHFEQAPGCVNVLDVGDEWPADAIVRAVNIAPHDLLHTSSRLTTMEGYWQEFQAGAAGVGSDS
ncbi:MAG: histidine phosphatase family protein [Actinomycetota bacterium]|nr:histidine phosphatase family protein [Actinomycetota bacterium]